MVSEDEGEGLQIDVKQKDWLDKFVRLGFSLQDDFQGNDGFRLGFAYRSNTGLAKDGYSELQAEIGIIPKLTYEVFQPLGSESPYFINPMVGYSRSQLIFRRDGEQLAEYFRPELFGNLNVGRTLGTSGEIYLGYTRATAKLDRQVGDPLLPEFDYEIGELASGLALDTLDKPDFPSEGYLFNPKFRQSFDDLGASHDFSDMSVSSMLPFTFGADTIALRYEGAYTFGQRPVERSFAIGGFTSVSGYAPNSIVGSDYSLSQILAWRRFSELSNPLFNFSFFMGGTFELTSVRIDSAQVGDTGLISSGSVFVGGDTPILPVHLGVGFADTGEHSVYFSIGRLGRSTNNN